MKKFGLALFLLLAISFSSVHAKLEIPTKKIELTIQRDTAYVNGHAVKLDQPPIILNQRTLVPLRFLSEQMHAHILWDSNLQQIILTLDDVYQMRQIVADLIQENEQHLKQISSLKEQLQWEDSYLFHARGNTMGNLINGGTLALHDSWIYFFNKRFLCRARSDFEEHEIIAEIPLTHNTPGATGFMNIIDGWIYFISVRGSGNDLLEETYSYPSHLCRIRTDGTGFEIIFTDYFHALWVVDDWIYLTITDEEHIDDRSSKLYRMKTDGSNLEQLLPYRCDYLSIVHGWVYFSAEIDGDPGIFRVRPNGTNLEKISDKYGAFVQVMDGWVYFVEWEHAPWGDPFIRNHIYRVRIDGTNQEKLTDFVCTDLNVHQGWIYFNGKANDSFKFFRMRDNGQDLEEIDSNVLNIHVFYNKLYFYQLIAEADDIDTIGFYIMNKDGSNKRKISLRQTRGRGGCLFFLRKTSLKTIDPQWGG